MELNNFPKKLIRWLGIDLFQNAPRLLLRRTQSKHGRCAQNVINFTFKLTFYHVGKRGRSSKHGIDPTPRKRMGDV